MTTVVEFPRICIVANSGTVRRIWIAMSESWPHREILLHAWHRLRPA